MATIRTLGSFPRNDQAFCAVMDVSRHGIRLRTGQPPEIGEMVMLRLGIGEDIHSIEGVTRRVELLGNAYDVGIEWTRCTAEQLAFLDGCSVEEPAPRA